MVNTTMDNVYKEASNVGLCIGLLWFTWWVIPQLLLKYDINSWWSYGIGAVIALGYLFHFGLPIVWHISKPE